MFMLRCRIAGGRRPRLICHHIITTFFYRALSFLVTRRSGGLPCPNDRWPASGAADGKLCESLRVKHVFHAAAWFAQAGLFRHDECIWHCMLTTTAAACSWSKGVVAFHRRFIRHFGKEGNVEAVKSTIKAHVVDTGAETAWQRRVDHLAWSVEGRAGKRNSVLSLRSAINLLYHATDMLDSTL